MTAGNYLRLPILIVGNMILWPECPLPLFRFFRGPTARFRLSLGL